MRSMKRRSLWIINQHAGGPGRHENMARELCARGWRVRVFAASFIHNVFMEQKEYPPGCFFLVEEEREVHRVWIKTPVYRGNGLARLLNHLAFARRVSKAGSWLEPPCAVIGSSPHLLAALAAFSLAKRHRVPFIFEVRDIWPQSLVDIGALGRFSPLAMGMGALEKFLYRQAYGIISVLPEGREYMASLGLDGKRVVHIPNGVDLAWYDRRLRERSLPRDLQNLLQRLQGRVVFIYAGAHGYANGLETVVRAAGLLQQKEVQSAHVLMVGDGPSKAGLVKTAREQGLSNITFLDAQDKELVPALLHHVDVCLFHLRKSGAYKYGLSSNKLFEYMAAARPMIAAVDMAPVPPFSRFGLQVPSDDPEALAGAMAHMAGMLPNERLKMGRLAREYVQRFHHVPVLADGLEEVLLDVLKPYAGSARP